MNSQVRSMGVALSACTSLEMAGASLTLLRLDSELEDLLAAPAEIAIRVF